MALAEAGAGEARKLVAVDPRFLAEIDIVVMDAMSKEPLAGVLVSVESWPFFEEDGSSEVVAGRSNAEGRLLMRVPLGRVVASARQESSAGEWLASASANLVSSERTTLRLELSRAAAVEGVVLSAISGGPIPGALVSNDVVDAFRSGPTVTDEQGRFTLSPWRMGIEAGVAVTAAGYGRDSALILVNEDGSWRVPARFGVPAGEGSHAPFLEFRLVPERIIKGVLVGSEGPIEGGFAWADGLLLFSNGVGQADRAEATTTASGEFVLRGLRPDVTQTVWVEASDLAPKRFLIEPGSAFVDLGTIALSPAACVRGRVAHVSGRSVPGVSVHVRTAAEQARPVDADPRDGENRYRDGFARPAAFSKSTIAAADGSFELSGLPEGKLVVDVRVERSSLGRREIELVAGEALVLAEPVVVEAERGELTGRVLVDSSIELDRAELEGLLLQVSDPVLGRVSQATSGAGGAFVLWGLREDEIYALRLLRKDKPLWLGAVSLDEDPFVIELSTW